MVWLQFQFSMKKTHLIWSGKETNDRSSASFRHIMILNVELLEIWKMPLSAVHTVLSCSIPSFHTWKKKVCMFACHSCKKIFRHAPPLHYDTKTTCFTSIRSNFAEKYFPCLILSLIIGIYILHSYTVS